MNLLRPTNRSIPAIVAVAVVIGVAMRPDAAVTAAYPLKADFSDAEDDSVLFGSVVPLMTNRFAGAGSRNRVRFETDTCGTLERLPVDRSMLRQVGLNEDMGDLDDEDPTAEAEAQIGAWVAAHPEIAVIADGIEKSCDSSFEDISDLSQELATFGRKHRANRLQIALNLT